MKRGIKTIDYLFFKTQDPIERNRTSFTISPFSLVPWKIRPHSTSPNNPCVKRDLITSKFHRIVSPRSIVLKFQERKKKEREKSLRIYFTFSRTIHVCYPIPLRYDEEKGEKKENTGSLVSRWSGSHAVFFSRRKKQGSRALTGARSSCKRRRERSNRDCNFSRTIKECYSAYNVYVRHDARGKPRGIESVTARQSAYTASRTSPPRDSQLESGAAQDGRRRTGSSIGCPLPLGIHTPALLSKRAYW